jgi:hypothetical protein
MKRLLTLSILLAGTFLITSCGSTYSIPKKLVGTWKTVNIEKLAAPGAPATTAAVPAEDKSIPDSLRYNHNPGPSKLDGMINRYLATELKTTLTINADKTAVKIFPDKTVHATWKVKKQGTRLLVTTKETGKKLTLNIIRVTDSTAVVTTEVQQVAVKITYRKENK